MRLDEGQAGCGPAWLRNVQLAARLSGRVSAVKPLRASRPRYMGRRLAADSGDGTTSEDKQAAKEHVSVHGSSLFL